MRSARRNSMRWWISPRSEEHTSELQSLAYLVCRLLLEKKKKKHRVLMGTSRCNRILTHSSAIYSKFHVSFLLLNRHRLISDIGYPTNTTVVVLNNGVTC